MVASSWAPLVDETAELRRGIITPEVVVLDFETAGVASRLLARLVDGIALFGMLLGASFALSALQLGTTGGIIVLVLLLAFVVFGYWMLFETLGNGRTPGKAALGLRVVTIEGAPVRFRHAAVRSMLGVVDFFLPPLGPVAVVSVLVTSRGQRLGDLAAGTIVLRSRTTSRGALVATPFQRPPTDVDIIARLALAPLTAAQSSIVRRFLQRAAELDPDARTLIAGRLSQRIAETTGVPCPERLHPEWYLHAVGLASLGFDPHAAGAAVASSQILS